MRHHPRSWACACDRLRVSPVRSEWRYFCERSLGARMRLSLTALVSHRAVKPDFIETHFFQSLCDGLGGHLRIQLWANLISASFFLLSLPLDKENCCVSGAATLRAVHAHAITFVDEIVVTPLTGTAQRLLYRIGNQDHEFFERLHVFFVIAGHCSWKYSLCGNSSRF
jgi:hypothetical protein